MIYFSSHSLEQEQVKKLELPNQLYLIFKWVKRKINSPDNMRIESCRKCGTELVSISYMKEKCPDCDLVVTH